MRQLWTPQPFIDALQKASRSMGNLQGDGPQDRVSRHIGLGKRLALTWLTRTRQARQALRVSLGGRASERLRQLERRSSRRRRRTRRMHARNQDKGTSKSAARWHKKRMKKEQAQKQ